ncbi:MAG: HEAT repeat domain-containing protein [Elusimicrobia bacterium]|nr:HEAT repeat domain-containing protein [Elusimicrobiota bacterium]
MVKNKVEKYWVVAFVLTLCIFPKNLWASGVPIEIIVGFSTFLFFPIIIPILFFIYKYYLKLNQSILWAALTHLYIIAWMTLVTAFSSKIPEVFFWKANTGYFVLFDLIIPFILLGLVGYKIGMCYHKDRKFNINNLLLGVSAPLFCFGIFIIILTIARVDAYLYQPIGLLGMYYGILIVPILFGFLRRRYSVTYPFSRFLHTGFCLLVFSWLSYPFIGSIILSKDLFSDDLNVRRTTTSIMGYANNNLIPNLLIINMEKYGPMARYIYDEQCAALVKIGKPSIAPLIKIINMESKLNFNKINKTNDRDWEYWFYHERTPNYLTALQKITGKNFGDDNYAWKMWWKNHKKESIDELRTRIDINDPATYDSVQNIDRLGVKLESTNQFSAAMGAMQLGDIDNEKSVDTLIQGLRDQNDPNIIMWIGKSLKKQGALTNPEIFPILLEKFKSLEVQSDSAVMSLLVATKKPGAVEALLEMAHSPNVSVKRAVSGNLGKLYIDCPDEEIIHTLTRYLNDPDKYVRINAVYSLKIINTEEGVDLLIEHLKTEKEKVVIQYIVLAFSEMKNIKAIPVLKEILEKETGTDERHKIENYIRWIEEASKGKNFDESYAAWLKEANEHMKNNEPMEDFNRWRANQTERR